MIEIPSVRSCGSYRRGHDVHWIQARLVWREPQPHIPVTVMEVDDDVLVVAAADGIRRLRNHDLVRMRALVTAAGPAAWLVGYGLLKFRSGHLVCVDEDDGRGLSYPTIRAFKA